MTNDSTGQRRRRRKKFVRAESIFCFTFFVKDPISKKKLRLAQQIREKIISFSTSSNFFYDEQHCGSEIQIFLRSNLNVTQSSNVNYLIIAMSHEFQYFECHHLFCHLKSNIFSKYVNWNLEIQIENYF